MTDSRSRKYKGRVRKVTRAPDEFSLSADEWDQIKSLEQASFYATGERA